MWCANGLFWPWFSMFAGDGCFWMYLMWSTCLCVLHEWKTMVSLALTISMYVYFFTIWNGWCCSSDIAARIDGLAVMAVLHSIWREFSLYLAVILVGRCTSPQSIIASSCRLIFLASNGEWLCSESLVKKISTKENPNSKVKSYFELSHTLERVVRNFKWIPWRNKEEWEACSSSWGNNPSRFRLFSPVLQAVVIGLKLFW